MIIIGLTNPADIGNIEILGQGYVVSDCLTGAYHESDINRFYFDKDIKVKCGEEGWTFFVGHVVEGLGLTVESGTKVILKVNKERQNNLSKVHSVAHLMSLALNKSLVDFWKKDVKMLDSLGHPNFDALAIQSSLIDEKKSMDVYCIGKSLRKKGFDTARFLNEQNSVADAISNTLNGSLLECPIGKISPSQSKLTEKRIWSCKINDEIAQIPCGGTHLVLKSHVQSHLKASLSLYIDEKMTLVINTYVQ